MPPSAAVQHRRFEPSWFVVHITRMRTVNHVSVAVLGAGSAFGATGGALALMGLGVPFLAATAATSACVGLVVYAALHWAGTADARPAPVVQADPHAEVAAAEARSATLRHALRGALSPALMVSDRLVSHADPDVKRAGEMVVRSIERATALISAAKPQAASATVPAAPASRP